MKMKFKIPGMLYILISYIPWIVYWIICGSGKILGLILPLMISLMILIPQIKSKNYNLMDIFTFIYFIIANVGKFIFNQNIFIEKSGFLGYLVLFIMALYSILINNPFTFQVSKRDYPETYWKDKTFFIVNKIITFVWLSIFFINSLIYLFLNFPINTILTNIFISFGIIFSIIYPILGPAYFVSKEYSKEYKKYDFKIKIDKDRVKGEDEYDVIVVGSGIGGLTTASLLSKRGYKVLVLEKHYKVGGFCSSFGRKGFIFNSGVEDVSGLWEKGPIKYLLKELELNKDELFVKNITRYIYKGKIYEAKDLESFINILINEYPDEKDNIKNFFLNAKLAYEECYKDSEYFGTPLPAELILKVFGAKKLVDYPKEHPHFYDWMNKSFKQKLDEYFKNEDLKKLLSGLIGYLGTEIDKTYASSALTACVSYYLYGGYYPKKGAQNFANSLKEIIEKYGGKVLVNHPVDEILVENGFVRGVNAKGKIFKSNIVVSNVNAKTTFLKLINEKNLDKDFIEYIKGLKMSPSCFMSFLGVDLDLSEYPTLIKDLDQGIDIVINSNADRSLSLPNKSSVTLITYANYYDFANKSRDEYLKLKNEYLEKSIEKANNIINGIKEKILVKDAATPLTFERYTDMPEGAIYSIDQSMGIKRPYFKTPVKGLYLASASTFPGGGIEGVVISGMICANDISGWNIKFK